MSANIHKAAWAPNRRRIAKSAAHPLRLEVKLRQSEMQYLRQMVCNKLSVDVRG